MHLSFKLLKFSSFFVLNDLHIKFKMQKTMVTILWIVIWNRISPLVSSVDTLKSGERLNSSAYLVSANNTFTLGFYTPEYSRNSYLGIWYTDREDTRKFPLWLANRNRPIYNDSGILAIRGSGEMIIEHNWGDPIELYKPENGRNVTATLLESGNFVVHEINSNGSSVLWQSFDYPTDTLLPGMKLGFNHVTGRNWILTSWLSEENPASGAFSLEWDSIGRRLIVSRRGLVYWTSGDLRLYNEVGDVKLYSFEYILYKPDLAKPTYIFKNFSSRDEAYFNYSVFENHIFIPGNRKINSRWRLNHQGEIDDSDLYRIAEIDHCYGYNTNYTTDGGVHSGGCELWNQPKCRNSHQNFSRQRDDSLYFYDFFNEASPNLSLSDCRANCWNDCRCVAFLHEVNGCSYWRGKNVTNGQDFDPLSSSRYVLVSKSSKKRWKKWMIIIPVTSASVLVALSFFILRKYKQGKRKKKELQELMMLEGYTETTEFDDDGGRSHDLKLFTYASILASTNKFSLKNKLGEGGFGAVYKGKMPEGREIAIKLLSQKSKQGLLEFKTELILISKLQHRNLVKLLGFCIHGNVKMIVYDYMPNKSLDFFLFDPVKREELNWETRFSIIEGIAQGLIYLHKHSRLLIVHRDLKAGNILLDENMNPKISDFGLARIFKENVPEVNTRKRVGTYGYMAPEYAMQGIFSVKSDIYSFGVLILEIVSGRRNNSFQNVEGPLTLVEFAWELWKQSVELELVDPMLNSTDTKDQLRRCIHVGLLCAQHRAVDRPPIDDVMSMLKNEITSLPMPKEPAFVVRDKVVQKSQKHESEKFSAHEVSVSTLDGR